MKQFRMFGLVLAAVMCLSSLVNADCSGRVFGGKVQSAMQRVAGVPAKIVAAKPVRATVGKLFSKANCSASQASCSAPAESGCSAPAMSGCSAPQAVTVIEAPQPVLVSVSVVEPQACASGTCSVEESARSFQPIRNSIAQGKANLQASQGRMRHVGGSFGAGRYEGVGFSTESADDAIRKCCYWGQRSPVDIGVARGANGWYATVLYR